ncbi:hypothetical protein BV898_14133 [Hypsibius exemplaris]|uniref:Uncharacterized protein n=1 Tax=Hypsibius exemplaris TaxID=2072580 RepID=A0A1W0W8N0_HYPEX|nr:hypothetical protein BV898_14133 [Hypsibius exemplaris]
MYVCVNVSAIPKKALETNQQTHIVSQSQRAAPLASKKQLNPLSKRLVARVASVTGTATPGTITKTTLAGAAKLPTQKPLR